MADRIPDTNNLDVAKLAAALYLTEATTHSNVPLKHKLRHLIDAYESIDSLENVNEARTRLKEISS